MEDPSDSRSARPLALVAGFVTLYLVWGSTYLGIKLAVETLPPFLMGGSRFVLPGLILYVVLRMRGAKRPTWKQWGLAALSGAFLLLGGNGLVTWGQQTVPSGRAALIVATMPLWMVVLAWLFFRGERPAVRLWLGLAVGFAGAALLIKPSSDPSVGTLAGSIALALAPLCWSIGSLLTKRYAPTSDALLTSAMQMLAGGVTMIVFGSCLGEWSVLFSRPPSNSSLLGFVYLAIAGGLIGFPTFTWLMKNASPAAVSTYAYVNPLVAVLLGWLCVGESLDSTIVLAAGLIVGAVILITLPRRRVRVNAEAVPMVRREGTRLATPATCGR